jgi:potassium-transporting ATPase potassium-binding subunit
VNDAKGNPVMEEQTVDSQTVTEGPMASQIAIKMLGTNGGGFVNANAAHPFENPTPLSNFIQMLSIFAIPSALTYFLGRMVKSQKHGWAVWGTMALVFVIGFVICWGCEAAGNPQVTALGVNAASGNMEGKEVRFGITNSALFATITTDASCGAVNGMHDSFTPIGGLIPMLNIQLGEIIFGGVGAGLYGMILFVVLAVFIAGLMVGRTPEYLGKKIESYDVKMAAFGILLMAFSILGFSGWASVTDWGQAGRTNMGPHGLSEILYAYTSCTGNNGSAFTGLTANPTNGDPHYDITLGFAMLIGRFGMIIPVMALAGSLARKKLVATGAGTFPVSGPIFIVLLIGTILLVGALTFFPALSLGPILEHFLMWGGKTY